VPGERVKACQRLVQDERPRPFGQRNSERELRALAAGQRTHLAIERDALIGDAG